mgnify:FL=1
MAESNSLDEMTGFFKKSRVLWAIRSISALIIGLIVLFWPQATISVLATLLGIFFVILGVIRIVQGLVDKDITGGAKAANIIIGGLVFAAGIIVIRNPFETAVFVVLLVGVSLIFEGIATLIDTARGNGSGLSIVLGILIALAGVLVILFADGVTVAYAVFFGITLIVVGILDLIHLLTVSRTLKSARA